MRGRIRRFGPLAWGVCALGLWIAAFTTARASGIAPTPTAQAAVKNSPKPSNPTHKDPPAVTPGATYVGEETCLTCHSGQEKGYADSPHHRATDPRTPAAAQSCETCHGPGSKHIEDPATNKMRQFSTMKPDEVTAVCTTCHNRGEHALWDGSTHESRGVTCTTCHSVHSAESQKGLLKKKTEIEVCATCHRDKVTKLMKSGHMPLNEGKMTCSSCHNMHGSTNVKLLKTGDSVSELCTSCHADKRGPFLWEHAPVRDGCTTCHDPHGSNNERMLVQRTPMLCQQCHISTRHPASIYDATSFSTAPSVRVFSNSCVTCHVAIHGSNHPSGERFLR